MSIKQLWTKGSPVRARPQLRLIATFLKAFTTVPAIFKALAAVAVFKALAALAAFKALAALLTLTTYKALAISAAKAALIETGTVPAIEVEAQGDFLGRVNLFER